MFTQKMLRNAIFGLMAFCLCTVFAESAYDGYWKTVSGELHDIYICVSDTEVQASYDGFAGTFVASVDENGGYGYFAEAGDYLGTVFFGLDEDGLLYVFFVYSGEEYREWVLRREAPNAGNKCGSSLNVAGIYQFDDGVVALCGGKGFAYGTYYNNDNQPAYTFSGHYVSANFAGGRWFALDGSAQGYLALAASESGVTMQAWTLRQDNGPTDAYENISLRGEVTLGKRLSGVQDTLKCVAGPSVLYGPDSCPEPEAPQVKKVNNIEFRFADLFNGAVAE